MSCCFTGSLIFSSFASVFVLHFLKMHLVQFETVNKFTVTIEDGIPLFLLIFMRAYVKSVYYIAKFKGKEKIKKTG